MNKLNENHYENFDINERINLTISALARGDFEEAKKLRRTCPRKRYIMIDYEYSKRLDALTWVAAFIAELHNFYYFKIILCRAIIAIYNTDSNLADISSKKVSDLKNAEIMHVSHFKAIYNGFYRFCTVAKLNENQLMAWLKISPLVTSEFIGLDMMMVEPDDGFSMYVKNQLLSIWNYDLLYTG